MPFTTPHLIQYEYCELKYDTLAGGNRGIVKRSGSGIQGGETGDYDRLLSLLGESGWELKASRTDPTGQTVLIFARPVVIPK